MRQATRQAPNRRRVAQGRAKDRTDDACLWPIIPQRTLARCISQRTKVEEGDCRPACVALGRSQNKGKHRLFSEGCLLAVVQARAGPGGCCLWWLVKGGEGKVYAGRKKESNQRVGGETYPSTVDSSSTRPQRQRSTLFPAIGRVLVSVSTPLRLLHLM